MTLASEVYDDLPPAKPTGTPPPSAQIAARITGWMSGDWPEGASLPQVLGWSEEEYAAWSHDPSAVPLRPLPASPAGADR